MEQENQSKQEGSNWNKTGYIRNGGGNGYLSSVLAWGIPGTEELGRLQSIGLQKRQTPLND